MKTSEKVFLFGAILSAFGIGFNVAGMSVFGADPKLLAFTVIDVFWAVAFLWKLIKIYEEERVSG